jgi:DNA adenine methylase
VSDAPQISAIAPWFGSNRNLAEKVGEQLAGCAWVGVPFAGGMCEVPRIEARTVLVNDLHRGVINLATCVREHWLRKPLLQKLRGTIFHPDTLAEAQRIYAADDSPRVVKAWAYFVICWMTRSGTAGTDQECTASLALRWTAGGGDSAVRFRSALRSIAEWSRVFARCTFSVMDAFEFLDRLGDIAGHGVYCDPPFPDVGARYSHSFSEADQRRLAAKLATFENCRVVVRYYDHPLIRELYPAGQGWRWLFLQGGKTQHGKDAPEVLIVKNTGAHHHDDGNGEDVQPEGSDKARARRHRKPRGVPGQ